MYGGAGKKLLWMATAAALLGAGPAYSATCYRSQPEVEVSGTSGPQQVTVLWNDNGLGMDRIRVGTVDSDLLCSDGSPVSCSLGEDGGRIRLLFEGSRLKVISRGQLHISKSEAGRPRLSVRSLPVTRVIALEPLSRAECHKIFPDDNRIEVFPPDQTSSPSGPLRPDSNSTK